MQRKTLKTLAIALAVLVGLGALVVGAFVLYLRPTAGRFDRRRFEAVVEEARRRPIRAGGAVALRLDPNAPDSVHLIEAEEELVGGGGAGRIWATRTEEGHLKVVIETRDMGHAGEYGFAYSEVPLMPVPLDANWSTVVLPGRLTWTEPDRSSARS